MAIRALRRTLQSNFATEPAGDAECRTLISELCEVLSEYLDESAVADIYRAYQYGADAHEGQVRSSGEAYIQHPIAVARILADMRLDSRSIMAAILHDVIEDTPTAREVLAKQFGEDVAYLVDGVSKIDQIEFESKEEAEAENFRKMLLAMSNDIRVVMIKLADRLHNMDTLEHLPARKQRRISRQTLDIYAPIAKRLGMHKWGSQLEDLSFKYLYPKRYDAISKALSRRQGNRRSVLKKVCAVITKELEQKGLKAEVSGRKKNTYSVYRKMRSKRLQLDEVQDIYAVRVIVDTVDECYRALGLVHNLFKPIPGKFKDYIAIPKANGYQSLHTIVFGTFGQTHEVQIRTVSMHRIAEAGIASHWMYKSSDKPNLEPRLLARQWLLDLLDTQKQAGTPSEFLEHLKVDLFPDQVYVFTPRGEIKKLPRGATALDFAYAVHSDIGNRCIGARINKQMVPLHARVRNGDHVEALTSRSAQPSPSWLNYVVTSKARAAIRTYLKNQQYKDSVKLGKTLLNRALKKIGFKPRRLKTEQKITFLKTLDLDDWNDLLADIGLGKRHALIVAKQLAPDVEHKTEFDDQAQPLAIQGAEGVTINYAKCCRPIPGDAVAGLFSKGRGIVVHTTDCPNLGELEKNLENWIDIQWADEVKGRYPVNLRLETHNKPGVLAALATIIAEEQSNINSVSVVEHDGNYATINFTIEVKNTEHLAKLSEHLQNEDTVISVQRVKG